MKKLFLLILPVLALSFSSCELLDGLGGDDLSSDTENTETTGSIKIENSYAQTGYGSVSSVAVIDAEGNYVKTSTKSISKGSSNTIDGIPVGTHKMKIHINTTLGVKSIEKTGIKVSSGQTTTVTLK